MKMFSGYQNKRYIMFLIVSYLFIEFSKVWMIVCVVTEFSVNSLWVQERRRPEFSGQDHQLQKNKQVGNSCLTVLIVMSSY